MHKLLDVALTQVGVKEDPAHKNLGESKKYQDSVLLPHQEGYPWCQSFAHWCGDQVFGMNNPVPKTAGVQNCLAMARKIPDVLIIEGDAISEENILPGDQFILIFGGGHGHTGFVLEMNTDGSFSTVEGNSNENGDRDGYEVAERKDGHKRHLKDNSLVAFIRYPEPEFVPIPVILEKPKPTGEKKEKKILRPNQK